MVLGSTLGAVLLLTALPKGVADEFAGIVAEASALLQQFRLSSTDK